MCIFSQAVDRVAGTSIFARGINGRQVIVYSMAYAARSDLAMVLPLPVPARPPEEAVRFISLEEYPEFFAHMEMAFPPLRTTMSAVMYSLGDPLTLAVHEVGDFEASFVPGLGDFDRLDPRFRIPRTVWAEMPAYQDYGFAVFKLRASMGGNSTRSLPDSVEPGTRKVHPMAFEFPRREPELLYFPTLHVHDRTIHPGADFDHVLYCQPEPGWDHAVQLHNWRRSPGEASSHIDMSKGRGLVNPTEHLFRLPLDGRRENRDTWVSVNSTYPEPVPA